MSRIIWLCTALMLSLCLLCGCGAAGSETADRPEPLNEGETYLEGAWYLDEGDLHVGYNLFPDGGGFLFIGETVVPIRYGIFDGAFYVSDSGNVESFPFYAAEDGLWMDGMLYRPVEEDPEVSAAVESMRGQAQSSELQPEDSSASADTTAQIGELIMQLVTLAAAVGVVVILVGFFRKKRKKS